MLHFTWVYLNVFKIFIIIIIIFANVSEVQYIERDNQITKIYFSVVSEFHN